MFGAAYGRRGNFFQLFQVGPPPSQKIPGSTHACIHEVFNSGQAASFLGQNNLHIFTFFTYTYKYLITLVMKFKFMKFKFPRKNTFSKKMPIGNNKKGDISL